MSIFNSLNIARSGLFASQKAIEVTGHNIANANTPGYSRQRLEVMSMPSISYQGASPGGGVSIQDLTQTRNKYLDTQYRNENSLANELKYKAEGFEYIEGVLAEPSEFGINAALSEVFNSIEQLSYNAEDSTLREIVVQNSIKLTDTMKSVADGLLDYQSQLDESIFLVVDEINMLGEKIQGLNQTIRNYENRGHQANDLRDERNLLVDQLSTLIPVDAKEDENGRFSVKIGGIYLVDHFNSNKMEIRSDYDDKNEFTNKPINKIYWANTTNEVSIRGGQLKGMLDLRDGETADNQGVAYYMKQLDTLAEALVEKFNDINRDGYTLPIDGLSSTGIDFFDPEGVTARTIAVSEKLKESGYNIAASSIEVSENNWGNNINLLKFNELRDSGEVEVSGKHIGNLEGYLRNTVSDLAITTNYFASRSSSQQTLTNHVENQKLMVSEVSIDEEMMNLIQYQHSYSAAAKLVNVVDEMILTLINMK
jgi:flagellar hook-associated protein 1 FlgK